MGKGGINDHICLHLARVSKTGFDTYRIVMIDDDGLGISDSQRLVKLFEDDIEQGHQWVRGNRDRKSVSGLCDINEK